MRGSNMSTDYLVSNKKRAVLWNLIMFVEMVGSAVVIPLMREGGVRPVYVALAIFLSAGAAVYAVLFESEMTEGILFWLIPLVYLISVVLILLFDNPLMFPFWTFGGILLLCAFRLRYGMFLNVFLLFVLGSMQNRLFSEVLLIQLLCLLLFGFVMPTAKGWKDAVNILISVAALLVSVRIVCYFTMEKELLTLDIFCVAVVYAIIVFSVLLLSKVLQNTILLQEQKESFDYLEELALTAEEQETDSRAVTEEATLSGVAMNLQDLDENRDFTESVTLPEQAELNKQLDSLCEESSPLLLTFSQRYPEAFLHARRVALIASEVADKLEGINTLLVKCGGYYHEIGRLCGERSVKNTLLVAEEEGFPVALQNVLREHTVDGDKPTSKEAALVLLTDNICGLCEHLKKTQKGRILIVKVIEKALNLRLTKGDLSQSGLTVGELSLIRNALADVIKEDMF